MMCFEVILPIMIAIFAVFGGGSLFFLIAETWFVSDNISVCIRIDTTEAAQNIEEYLREAGRRPLAGSNGVTVLVCREYAEPSLVRDLSRRGIRYYIVEN